jgi:hypothetical protein
VQLVEGSVPAVEGGKTGVMACLQAARLEDTPLLAEQEAQTRTLAEEPLYEAWHTTVQPGQAELGYLEERRSSDEREPQAPQG